MTDGLFHKPLAALTPEDVRRIAREEIAGHVADRHTRKAKAVKPGLEGFEKFWSIWTRKVGRGAAEKAWLRIGPGPLLESRILAAAQAQVNAYGSEWARTKRQYQPHPATWLNQKRWLDQIESGVKAPREPEPRKREVEPMGQLVTPEMKKQMRLDYEARTGKKLL